MLRKLLPHAAIILSLMYFVFYAIDRVNPVMAFIDNEITKALLVLLGAIACANAVLLIRDDRARERKRQKQSHKRHTQQASRKAQD